MTLAGIAMRSVGLLLFSFVALCACQNRNEPAPGAVTINSVPLRKAGLWKVTTSEDGKPTLASGATQCVDDASEASKTEAMHNVAQSECPDEKMLRDPDGVIHISMTCPTPGGKSTERTTVSGDFSTSETIHTERDTTGMTVLPQMNGHHVSDVTATYQGECPPEMKPGDVDSDQMRILRQQAEQLKAHAAGQ